MTAPTCALCERPLADQAYVCSRCARIVGLALEDVPDLVDELDTTIARLDRIEHRPPSAGPHGPALRLEPDELPHRLHAHPIGPICAAYRRGRLCEHSFRQRRRWPQDPTSCEDVQPLVTTLHATALPVAIDASNHIAEASAILVTAAARIAHTRGHPNPLTTAPACDHETCRELTHRTDLAGPRCARRVNPRPLTRAARYLLGQLEWIRHRPDAPALLWELRDASVLLERVVDRPADQWYAGPCDCGRDLYAQAGAAEVVCAACELAWPVQARRTWLLAHADHQLLPATEIARALTGLGERITPDRIWKWRERGRLHPVVNTNPPLYRVGDVRALLVDDHRTRVKPARQGNRPGVTPQRIRLQRTKGWRKPTDAVVVARPSRWGNPYAIRPAAAGAYDVAGVATGLDLAAAAAASVDAYRHSLLAGQLDFTAADVLENLAGHDLCCWCPPDQACHADVLLEVANPGTVTPRHAGS